MYICPASTIINCVYVEERIKIEKSKFREGKVGRKS